MGISRRGVVVGRTCGRKRLVKKHDAGRRPSAMERKLRQLHKIIPGGGGGAAAAAGDEVVDTEALFQRIAVYVFQLESRIKLLKSVYALVGPHD